MQVLDNGNGLLLETDFGTEVMRTIRATGGNAGWVAGLEKTLNYARSLNELVSRSTADYRAFIPSYSASSLLPLGGNLVSKFGRKIFSDSRFQDALERFTPEGTTRLLRSLDEFTQTVQGNQSVFAGLVFEDIGTNLLKPKLNAWANGMGGGVTQHAAGRTVAGVGYYFQLFTTAGTLVAMAGDFNNDSLKLIKRAGGHLVGLAISAALGSEEAKTELGKMAPGYAEYLLGLEQMEQWEQGDYFEAGRTQFNFDLQVLGDLTIAVPVAKGVTLYFSDDSITASLFNILSRPQAQWVWARAASSTALSSLPVMKLDASSRLTLYDPAVNGQAGVVLDPQEDGVSTLRGVLRVRPGGDIDMGEFTAGGEP